VSSPDRLTSISHPDERAATVLLVIGFNLMMPWRLEVPLASFLVAARLDTACDRSSMPSSG
jgi:hypothetical protein